MNEYLVSIYLTEDRKISSNIIVEAVDKTAAVCLAEKQCEEKGFNTFGHDFCDNRI